MSLNFPDNPQLNDTFTVNGRTYTWNGSSWVTVKARVPDVLPTLSVDNDFSAGGTLHVDSSAGRIGVGSDTPSHQFHITQDLGVDGNVTLYDSLSVGASAGVTLNLDVGTYITVPTPTVGSNDTKVATTEFVQTAVSNLVDAAPATLDTLNELAAALGDDANFATTVTNSISLKLDSSAYTASDVLSKLLTVDGASSGLDADLLDGNHASAFATSGHTHSYLPLSGGTMTGSITIASGSSANAFAGGLNYWRPQDQYGNSYFDINNGQFYVDSDTYYFRNRASQNRLVIDSSGNMGLYGGTFTAYNGAVIGGTFIGANGTDIYGTAGRNYFKDSEKSSGNGLRVGAAWGYYGIYSESGDAVVGAQTGTVRFNNDGARVVGAALYGSNVDSGGGRLTGSWGGIGAPGVQMRSGNTFNTSWTGNLQLYVDFTLIKNFVIDHPQNPSSQWLIHACAEGPTADVFYRGQASLSNGIAIVELPEYFEDLTETEGRTVMITPIAGPNGHVANLAAYEICDGRFVVEQVGGYHIPNQRFWWRVDAVRKNTSFPVQPMKSDVTIGGDGPYRYIKEMAV